MIGATGGVGNQVVQAGRRRRCPGDRHRPHRRRGRAGAPSRPDVVVDHQGALAAQVNQQPGRGRLPGAPGRRPQPGGTGSRGWSFRLHLGAEPRPGAHRSPSSRSTPTPRRRSWPARPRTRPTAKPPSPSSTPTRWTSCRTRSTPLLTAPSARSSSPSTIRAPRATGIIGGYTCHAATRSAAPARARTRWRQARHAPGPGGSGRSASIVPGGPSRHSAWMPPARRSIDCPCCPETPRLAMPQAARAGRVDQTRVPALAEPGSELVHGQAWADQRRRTARKHDSVSAQPRPGGGRSRPCSARAGRRAAGGTSPIPVLGQLLHPGALGVRARTGRPGNGSRPR